VVLPGGSEILLFSFYIDFFRNNSSPIVFSCPQKSQAKKAQAKKEVTVGQNFSSGTVAGFHPIISIKKKMFQ
jgi:hypothetical protein